MHQCRESVEEGIRHLITLATGIFKGGVRGREKEKEAARLRSSPGLGGVCLSAVPRGFTKGGPELPPPPPPRPTPRARFGDSPPRPRRRVNSGSRSCQPWVGRAGRRPERRVGQPRGARRRPQPPTVCKRPRFGAERSAPLPATAASPRLERGAQLSAPRS